MIVLDTHIWHWWVNQIPGKLSPATITLIEESDEVGVSAISCFEMAWLVRHGRIDLDMSFDEWLQQVEADRMNKRPRSKLRGIGLPKNAASYGEWTRRDSMFHVGL